MKVSVITRESLPYATIQLEGKQRYSVVAGDGIPNHTTKDYLIFGYKGLYGK